jgi:hypothetical protein
MAPKINITPLLEEALDALRNRTGLEAEWVREPAAPLRADAEITIKKGQRVWTFNVEVKPWLNRALLNVLKERIRTGIGEWLLVTRYVTGGQADELRAMNLAFLDTAGNAFINRNGLFVFMKGEGVGRDRGPQKEGIFRPAELRVLFAFLCRKGLEGQTHEKIKQMAGVGIGTVNRLIRALELAGYILKLKGQNRRLVRKKELLEQWAIAYPQRLRPKQMIGRFTGPRGPWWDDVDLLPIDAQWGGEIAANYLTQYLKPQLVTLYATKQPDDMIIKQRLRKDPQGDVEILRRFWNFTTGDQRADVVPPLLVYADLLATGDERNTETARLVYEEYLARLVRED